MIAHKVKAAIRCRHCNTTVLKRYQITRFTTGNQTLRSPGWRRSNSSKMETRILTILDKRIVAPGDFHISNSHAHNKPCLKGADRHKRFYGTLMSPYEFAIYKNFTDQPLPEIVAQSTTFAASREFGSWQNFLSSFSQLYPAIMAITINTATIQSKGVLGINIFYSSALPLACLRWRRFISPCIAVTINWAVLSPCSLTCSIASTTSCGARVCNFCDLSFFVPVAIARSPNIWWSTEYQKKSEIKPLKWSPLSDYSGLHLEHSKLKIQRSPEVLGTQTGRLTKSLIEVTIMAGKQHTQTHPKYTWRLSSKMPQQPVSPSVESIYEQEYYHG